MCKDLMVILGVRGLSALHSAGRLEGSPFMVLIAVHVLDELLISVCPITQFVFPSLAWQIPNSPGRAVP